MSGTKRLANETTESRGVAVLFGDNGRAALILKKIGDRLYVKSTVRREATFGNHELLESFARSSTQRTV